VTVTDLRFMHPSPLVTAESSLYQPPSIPPPDDWVVSVDHQGKDLSRYGDGYWYFHAFGFPGFNFARQKLSEINVISVKQILYLVLYHPNLFPGKIRSCKAHFECLVKIARVCETHGIPLQKLSRFPRIHQDVADALQCSNYEAYVRFLHKLRLYTEILGFEVADAKLVAFLTSRTTNREIIQHPYIPPRIWSYQVNRLSQCLDDFLKHQEALELVYVRLSDAYEYNLSLTIPRMYASPFTEKEKYSTSQRVIFEGGFRHFLAEYGLLDLFEKWFGKDKRLNLMQLPAYLNMIRDACLLYILNFSLQRAGEVLSLRSDCFSVEKDEQLGDIALIAGETTKTDPDDDARWVVPKEVQKAVAIASSIAKWRMRHRPKNFLTLEDKELPPFLATPAWEPWSGGGMRATREQRVAFLDLGSFTRYYPHVMDPQAITVTEADWKIALSLTPNLHLREGFGVGLPWRFSAHQLRRTTAVNMFASHAVSQSSLQWVMKHLSRNMTLYYGRNYTNLKLNSMAENAVIFEYYREIYRQLVAVVENNVEYVNPHPKETVPTEIINLVDAREEDKLNKLIKKQAAGCRRILLGFCLKPGSCEYGGIESASKCAGADGRGVCADVRFERKKEPQLIGLKEAHELELKTVAPNSPRHGFLTKEIYAIGVYLDAVNR
jgi:hypothetical protein